MMDKIKILNPGAYSIFIRQLVRDDGFSINEINRQIGWKDYYANTFSKIIRCQHLTNAYKQKVSFLKNTFQEVINLKDIRKK